MDSVSIQLQKFIHNNPFPNGYNPIPKLSPTTINVLEWIYYKIIRSTNSFDFNGKNTKGEHITDMGTITSLNKKITNVYTELGLYYKHIQEPIRRYIDKKITSSRVYTFNVYSNNVELTIIFPNSNNTSGDFNDILRKTYMWLHIAYQFSSPECSNHLRIFIIMSDLTKTTPIPDINKTHELSEVNVNSAQTTSCRPENEIHIYRSEEWFKVLIHETMHALGIDFSHTNDTNMIALNEIMKNTFVFKMKDLRLYESYCEAWAEIINVLFCVYFSRTETDDDDVLMSVEKSLQMERKWVLFQCAKIIKFYGLTYTDIYNLDPIVVDKLNAVYLEKNTTTFSYYIAKAIILFNIDTFFEWCINSNIDVIRFKNTRKTILSFGEFIISKCDYPDMVRSIAHYENILTSPEKYNSLAIRTMRMSIH